VVEDLSQGKTEEGFDKLDEFGVIREIEKSDERQKAICDLHIAALKEKQRSLIVAPTHGEARRIAAAVALGAPGRGAHRRDRALLYSAPESQPDRSYIKHIFL
jgi:hypothetical protein